MKFTLHLIIFYVKYENAIPFFVMLNVYCLYVYTFKVIKIKT